MNKILPFDDDVLIDTYHYLAYPFGVLRASFKDETYYNSVIKHCSNLIWYGSDATTQLAFDSDFFTYWDSFKRKEINNEFITKVKKEKALYIIKSINENNYVYLCVDDFYMPRRFDYKKRHFKHDLLIYGYDDFLEIFMIAGYNDKGHYCTDYLSFQDFYKANPEDLVLLAVDDRYELNYKKNDYMEFLKSYISSNEKDRGLNSCYRLLEFIDAIDTDFELYDIKPFIVFLKHKSVIHLVMNRIMGNNCHSDLYNKYEKQFDLCDRIKLSMIKYRFTKERKILSDVKELLKESIEIDVDCLLRIL